MKTKLITAGDLPKFIDGIKTRAKKLDGDIQVAAMSAAAHFAACGDTGFINRLYLALGKGARHVAMTAWVTSFAGVSANEGESKDTQPFVKDANKKVDLEAGEQTPWYDMKASPKPDEVLDILKLTLALIKKAAKPKEGQEVAHAAMLPELQALAEKFAPVEEVAEATDDDQA